MRDYDLAFSLGFSCGCTQSLRQVDLQYVSFPFDWVGSPGLLDSVRMLTGRFEGWLEKADLELYDVRRAPLFSRVYRNRRTKFGFPHDFPSGLDFDDAYGQCRRRYDRRIERLIASLVPGRRALAVYIERMIDPRLPDSDIRQARRLLSEAFPGVEFDLLYFFQQDDRSSPLETVLDEGVRTVALDYRIVVDGVTSHEVERSGIADYLRKHVSVPDVRSEADKARYREARRESREHRWGKVSPVRRLFNEIAYKLYRRFERRLVGAGVLPRENPLWF